MIEIYEVEEGVWPFSEKIRIVTKLNLEDLEYITEELCYDEIWKEEISNVSVPDGYTAYSLWWD